MTQREYIGLNSIKALQSILEGLSARQIFLVMEEISYSICGAKDYMESLTSAYAIKTYSGFDMNPNIDDLEFGIKAFGCAEADVVIAIGGGSVIDMAKMINFFGCNRCDPRSYLAEDTKSLCESKPLIAIPTTAGTGSEATHFAVLYIDHVKHSVADPHILPDIAIIDPALTMSMPPRLTAITGMDALSQAIESYWCVNSNDESKRYAAEAITLIMSNLELAVNEPTEAAKFAMAKAAHLAGKAINITKTTAPHAISYPLTSLFGIPHGHAVALTLSSMMVYNHSVTDSDVLDKRGCGYVRRSIEEIAVLLGTNDVDEAKQKIDELMFKVGLETKLSDLRVTKAEDIQRVTENGFNPARVMNNPRLVTTETMSEMLSKLL